MWYNIYIYDKNWVDATTPPSEVCRHIYILLSKGANFYSGLMKIKVEISLGWNILVILFSLKKVVFLYIAFFVAQNYTIFPNLKVIPNTICNDEMPKPDFFLASFMYMV